MIKSALMAVVAAAAVSALPASAIGFVGLNSSNDLVTYDTSAPGTPLSIATVSLSGGGTLVGIDYRRDGLLYGLASNGSIYTLNATAGTATLFSTPAPGFTVNSASGVDFNPVPNALRIVDSNNANLRIAGNPALNVTNTDTPVSYAAGDANFGADPFITGAGYTNGIVGPGPANTSLYLIDSVLGILALQGSVGGTPTSPNTGLLTTVGSLGLGTNLAGGSALVGFDIFFDGTFNTGFLTVGSNLYNVNLGTGAATFVSGLGNNNFISVAVAPVPEPLTVLGLVGFAGLVGRKLRRS